MNPITTTIVHIMNKRTTPHTQSIWLASVCRGRRSRTERFHEYWRERGDKETAKRMNPVWAAIRHAAPVYEWKPERKVKVGDGEKGRGERFLYNVETTVKSWWGLRARFNDSRNSAMNGDANISLCMCAKCITAPRLTACIYPPVFTPARGKSMLYIRLFRQLTQGDTIKESC